MSIRIVAIIEQPLSPDSDTEMGLGLVLEHLRQRGVATDAGHFGVELELVPITAQNRDDQLRLALARFAGDQLWLFGASSERGQAVSDQSIKKLLELMQRGVGVFATGDHLELGAPLCGGLPRIRRLRYWRRAGIDDSRPPAADGHTRNQTGMPSLISVDNPNADYDATPKRVWFVDERLNNGMRIDSPHPLGFHPAFPGIAYLPDHMHEGICRVPDSSLNDASNDVDYRDDFPDGHQYEPVAYTTRLGFDRQGRNDRPEVEMVLSCFDHPEQGRVVVDSTFHHWTNGNVKDMVSSLKNNGFQAWLHAREYAINIAAWLARKRRRPDPILAEIVALAQRRSVSDALIAYWAKPTAVTRFRALKSELARALNRRSIDPDRAQSLIQALR